MIIESDVKLYDVSSMKESWHPTPFVDVAFFDDDLSLDIVFKRISFEAFQELIDDLQSDFDIAKSTYQSSLRKARKEKDICSECGNKGEWFYQDEGFETMGAITGYWCSSCKRHFGVSEAPHSSTTGWNECDLLQSSVTKVIE